MKNIVFLALMLAVVMLLAGCSNTYTTYTNTCDTAGEEATTETLKTLETLESTISEPQLEWTLEVHMDEDGVFRNDLLSYGEHAWQIPRNAGNKITFAEENLCIVNVVDRGKISLYIANAKEDTFVLLTGEQWVIDSVLAGDTLYWYNTNREVWTCDWQDSQPTASLFCRDALGLSPYADEAQGAIVSPERANWEYGYGLPIYSPYGIAAEMD